jgi:hypothetical protein
MNEYIKVNPIGGSGGGGISYPIVSPDDITLDDNKKLYLQSNQSSYLYSIPNSGTLSFAFDTLQTEPFYNLFLASDGGASNQFITLFKNSASQGQRIAYDAGAQHLFDVNGRDSFMVDYATNPGETSCYLFDVDSGLLQRVKVTANNAVAGVTGRVLYVDNI